MLYFTFITWKTKRIDIENVYKTRKSMLKEITCIVRSNANLAFLIKWIDSIKTRSSRMDCDVRVYNRSGPAGVCERVALSFRFSYVLRVSD